MLSKIRKKQLESNIGKTYLLSALASFFLVGPIFILFLQDNGLSMLQIMILETVYTATIMLTTVPFGIVADYIGRKKVLVGSAAIFFIGWIVYGFGNSFSHFFVAEIVLAISSAAWIPPTFLYDNLRELKKESSFKKLFGKSLAYGSISFGFAALIGGFIATHSLRLPIWLMLIPSLGIFILTLTLTETKNYRHGEKKYITHLKDAIAFTAKHPKVRFFILYTAIVWAILNIAFVFYQPYFKSLGVPLALFGVLYAAMSGSYAISSKYAHWIEEKLGEKKILLLILVGLAFIYGGMAITGVFIGIILPIAIAFIEGVFQPVTTDYLNKHVESHHRATVNALANIVQKGTIAASAPFFGYLFDVYTLQAALVVASAILILTIFILSLMYVIGWDRLRNGKKELI